MADPVGATARHPPLKLDQLCFLINFFLNIRIRKNKAQIARESIKTTLALPGPWTPAESEFGYALVRPKKNCYVALTCTKFENWSVGRSIFFFFFFYVP